MLDPVLLIGAGGFVGQALLDAMTRRGDRVIAVGRRAFAAPDNGAECHVQSVHSVSDYRHSLSRVRAVIHVASRSTPGSSAGQPVQELEENLLPTVALLEALQSCPNVPLVYVSSGGSLYSRVPSGASDELAAVYSRSYHGAGKIAAEHFIEAWCNQFHGDATVLRPSNLYGPGQYERAGFGVVPTAFGKLLRHEVLHVWGDGSAERDYLYIDDFTRLVLASLDSARGGGYRIFNACNGASIDLNGLFALIERVTGQRLQRTYDAGRAVDAPSVWMQAARARRAFGWLAEVGLQAGLERTWHWCSTLPR